MLLQFDKVNYLQRLFLNYGIYIIYIYNITINCKVFVSCHILFSDIKGDIFLKLPHREQHVSRLEELLCFHVWMPLQSEEVQSEKKHFIGVKRSLETPKNSLPGRIKALRSKLYFTC